VKLGEPFPFKIFVRDTNDVIVKNKTLTVLVNDKAQFTSTDEAGKAPLEFSQTQSPGKVLVTVALGGKSTALEITVLDTKPSLASSPVGCSQDGCHIRLGSESGDWIPGWLVTAKAPADSAYLARTKTDALGLATFPLPPRSFDNPEYTYYICIDVESIGTKCGGF